jgi:hypothetical protein
MMRYALLVHSAPGSVCETSDADVGAMMRDYETHDGLATVVDAVRLQPPTTAKTVRSDGRSVLVTDGPFAETKEFFGGMFIIEAPSAQAALEVARQLQQGQSHGGAIEVRPLVG